MERAWLRADQSEPANRNTIIYIGEQSLRYIDTVRRQAWAQANPDPSPDSLQLRNHGN